MNLQSIQSSLVKLAVCAAVPLLFYCQSSLEPSDITKDNIEFESVGQYCRALSIYQDSSIYEGRIPSDPFAFRTPQEFMHAIADTLRGHFYTDYFSYSVPVAGKKAVYLDSLTRSTALLTITTFDTSSMYGEFLDCAPAALSYPNIVVNVRHNRGGFLDQAGALIGALLQAGTKCIYVRQRAYDDNAKKYVTLSWYPLTVEQGPMNGFEGKRYAVLMDTLTASASEIVAAALYEGDTATRLIGTRSYGKAMGQSVIIRRTRLPLLITSLQFKGVSARIGEYHRKGIQPDTIPQNIIQQGDSLDTEWKKKLFYAVKMLEPTATIHDLNYPPERRDTARIDKTIPGCVTIVDGDACELPTVK